MPVIISPDNYARWLAPGVTDPAEIASMMRACPAGQMVAWEVSRRVNKLGNDGSDLIEPVSRSADLLEPASPYPAR
jgi:putative SOS response-associated peptidase YedK